MRVGAPLVGALACEVRGNRYESCADTDLPLADLPGRANEPCARDYGLHQHQPRCDRSRLRAMLLPTSGGNPFTLGRFHRFQSSSHVSIHIGMTTALESRPFAL